VNLHKPGVDLGCARCGLATTILIGLLLIGQLCLPSHGKAGAPERLSPLMGRQDGLLIEAPSGESVVAHNTHTRLVPASTLKVLTALVALHYLGTGYRFPTEFYLDGQSNLIVKGYGDPLLVSEALAAIARELAGRVATIHDIVLDNSYFERPIHIPGRSRSLQPYDAPNGALCANFNTVNFTYESGHYVSAEPQTPLVPFVLDKIRNSGAKPERITFSQEQDDIPVYVGHLLTFFLQQEKVGITGRIRMGLVRPEQDKLVLRYLSAFDLEQVIARMLEYSNNFIANQLLIASGVVAFGAPGTLAKGVQALQGYARQTLGFDARHIVEGSGISRKNRISAAEMGRVLEAFEPYYRLMRHAGRVFYKTGTLNGISTRVGYIEKQGGGFFRFVVLINTPGKPIEPIVQSILDDLP
jgi:D-alanyl-D-alanine carboxypeptidase/D-alanyl-D-alanine-endopeptidase (penicillin-binding protein 4)